MKVLKIKDGVPIEFLEELGFQKYISKDIYGNETICYSYSIENDEACFEFEIGTKENRILHIGTTDQTYVHIPNIIYHMIEKCMIEIVYVDDN